MSGTYFELAPAARLARYVECYWVRREGDDTLDRVLPDGCVDILFARGGGLPVAVHVVGLMTAPLLHQPRPSRLLFGIRFRPGMATAFLPEAAQLNDSIEPLETFWGAAARRLCDAFGEVESAERMIHVVEPHLRPLQPPDAVERALGQLASGRISPTRPEAQCDLSARHVRRGCVARSGVGPKLLSRILRFRRTVDQLYTLAATRAQPNWAQLAVACGYYDQAHLIRDFQQFAGVTPGRFLQSRPLVLA